MLVYAITFIAGCLLGRVAAAWASLMLAETAPTPLVRCPRCETHTSTRQTWAALTAVYCRNCGNKSGIWWPLLASAGLGLLYAGYTWLLLPGGADCQQVHEVRPPIPVMLHRLPYHLALMFLLAVTVITDFLDYVIPDEVVLLGVLTGVGAATAFPELQIIHIWVNWDAVIPGVEGPYLPEWIKHHPHLHGLAWSLAGIVTGATLTWLIRASSALILGQPALGLGDVTLMGMIGAFLGWQPVLCVLAIAPLAGLLVGPATRLISGRGFVAYGPYLAFSAVIVLCTWRWLWADFLTLRDIFSHWPSVATLIGGAYATLLVLLLLLRGFRSLPAKRLRR